MEGKNSFLHNKGLTLVELLVALAILVLVLSIVYPALFLNNKTTASQLKESAQRNEVRAVSSYLTNDIRYSRDITSSSQKELNIVDKDNTTVRYYIDVDAQGNTFLAREKGSVTGFEEIRDASFIIENSKKLVEISLVTDIANNKHNDLKVNRLLTYLAENWPTHSSGTEPAIPPPLGDGVGEAVNSDPYDAVTNPYGITWTDSGGDFNNVTDTYTVPVIFNHPGGVTKLNGFNVDVKSPAMYFLDLPVSLYVKKNMKLTLRSDFIMFSGNVNSGGDGWEELDIYTDNSTINGNDVLGLSGDPGIKYGVMYIGGTINGNTPNGQGTGYYYCPEGTNLFSLSDLDKLVKINDIGTINFSKLQFTIINS